jgi:hypothetical protein
VGEFGRLGKLVSLGGLGSGLVFETWEVDQFERLEKWVSLGDLGSG